MRTWLGFDIGGTKTGWLLADDDGRVLGRGAVPTPGSPDAITEVLLREIAANTAGGALAGIGVASMGVIDPRSGTVLTASDSIPGWTGHRLGTILRGAQPLPVAVLNDVNAFLLGEIDRGALHGAHTALGVMLGTGVGGAVQLSGQLYAGDLGGAAEIGHMPGFGDLPCTCGGRGHLETLTSGRSLALRYQERTGRPTRGAAEVAELARAGDSEARAVFTEAGDALGRALAMAGTLFDLDRVVCGGGVTASWDLLEPGLEQALAANPLVSGRTLRVRRAALGSDAVCHGAISAAVELCGR
ncbi:sugar kinase [Enemella evansiae]|uniref:Sugar kinase n=1 Tax=Enemella evansiae TaxID=2016499 RepID=A0A255GLN3_9ACTN|nr:ROK family protein [Enemella evansiae]OYO16730.1 sugar kinase [Enemella evansiae]